MQCSEQREGYTLTFIGLKALVLHTTMINHRSKITKKRIVSFVNSEASPKGKSRLTRLWISDFAQTHAKYPEVSREIYIEETQIHKHGYSIVILYKETLRGHRLVSLCTYEHSTPGLQLDEAFLFGKSRPA